MDGIFKLVKNLFNVEFFERKNVDVWHKDVLFYDVFDLDWSSTEPVGSFYFDPYARGHDKFSIRNSGWVLLIRNKSEICGVKPLSSLIYNFQPPIGDKPSMLSFKDVKSLFGNVKWN